MARKKSAAMTDAQKLSAIKRINQSIKDLTRGTVKLDASAARAKEVLETVIPKEYLTKSGNVSHGKAALEGISDDTIQQLEKAIPKRGEIIKDLKRKVAAEENKDVSRVTMEEVQAYADTVAAIKKAQDDDDGILYGAYAELRPKGTKGYDRRLTYNEVYEKVKELIKGATTGAPSEAEKAENAIKETAQKYFEVKEK